MLYEVITIGRGKQKGIKIDQIYYDELPKTMLMIVVEDEAVESVIEIVTKTAYRITSYNVCYTKLLRKI